MTWTDYDYSRDIPTAEEEDAMQRAAEQIEKARIARERLIRDVQVLLGDARPAGYRRAEVAK